MQNLLLDLNVIFDGEFLANIRKNIFWFAFIAVTIIYLVFKSSRNLVDLVEIVKFAHNFVKDRLTVAYEQIKKLLIFLNVIRWLFSRKEDFFVFHFGRFAVFWLWNLTLWGLAVFLKLGYVALAEEMGVSDKLLAVEASHHTVVKRFFVP